MSVVMSLTVAITMQGVYCFSLRQAILYQLESTRMHGLQFHSPWNVSMARGSLMPRNLSTLGSFLALFTVTSRDILETSTHGNLEKP